MAMAKEDEQVYATVNLFVQQVKRELKEPYRLDHLETWYNLHFKSDDILGERGAGDRNSHTGLPIFHFKTIWKTLTKLQMARATPDGIVKMDFRNSIIQRRDVLRKLESDNFLKDQQRKPIVLDQGYFKCMATKFSAGRDRELVMGTLMVEKPSVAVFFGDDDAEGFLRNQFSQNSYQLFGEAGQRGPMIYVHNNYEPACVPFLSGGKGNWIKIATEEVGTTYFGLVNDCHDPKTFSHHVVFKMRSALTKQLSASVLFMGETNLAADRARDLLKTEIPNYEFQVSKHGTILTIKMGELYFARESMDPLQGSVDQRCLFIEKKVIFCNFCNLRFDDDEDLQDHRATQRHRFNYCAALYASKRSKLICPEDKIQVLLAVSSNESASDDVANGIITWKVERGKASTLPLKIKNNASKNDPDVSLVARFAEFLLEDPDVTLTDEHGFSRPEVNRPDNVKNGIRIRNGASFNLNVNVVRRYLGQFKLILTVTYTNEIDRSSATVAKEILVVVTNSDVTELKPVSPYCRPKPKTKFKPIDSQNIVPGIPFVIRGREKDYLRSACSGLRQYKIAKSMRQILQHEMKQFAEMTEEHLTLMNATQNILYEKSFQNHCEKMEVLIQAEEVQMEIDIKNYDLEQVPVKYAEKGSNLLEIKVPGLAENRPSVLQGDKVIATLGDNHTTYEGIVHQVLERSIRVGFNVKNFVDGMKMNVRFTVNRFPTICMRRAIELLKSNEYALNMINPSINSGLIDPSGPTCKSFFNRLVEKNPEQMKAVKNILAGGIKGIPYIIFGPPGTGKTVTVVEAIAQVWRHIPNSHIVAAAPSNAAADVLASRIMKFVPETDILRYYAPSREEIKVPDGLKPITSFRAPIGTKEELMRYRIIVVTLVTATRLSLAKFPDGHFTHVFIDEAGHAMEPEACIPLSGVLAPNSGQLILAGDPKQLGPVVRSRLGIKYGLQLSLLERLMEKYDVYQRHDDVGYDNRCITKLLKNFRSHEALLDLPSRLFYQGELIASADLVSVTSLEHWEKLPNTEFPLMFHGVIGNDEREASSPSFFNREEVVTVIDYIEALLSAKHKVLAKDIGVISPYRKQVQKIRELLNKRYQKNKSGFKDFKEITVGSTEEFQGQERRVIIITTVRSEPDFLQQDFKFKLGFLKNPKRFNVAITRSKALLIVVGNPKLLSLDPHWRDFIKYAQGRGGYTGVKFNLDETPGKVKDVELLEMECKFQKMDLDGDGRDLNSSFSSYEGISSASSFDKLDDILPEDFPEVPPEQ